MNSKILNPITNRWVDRNGRIGRKLIAQQVCCNQSPKLSIKLKSYSINSDQTYEKLTQYAYSLLDSMYDNGKELVKTQLKTYSGPKLESFSKSLIKAILLELQFSMKHVEINQNYIVDPNGVFDHQRLDQHVWYKGKIIFLQEDRAWIDKPFYTLKRAVVRQFMELPYVNQHLHPEVEFSFLTFSSDLTDKTVKTQDAIQGYGDRVHLFELNEYRRNKYPNWYIGGYSKENVAEYIKFLVNHFSKFM